jgi:GNAT superfamily N-acetyltransferase
MADSAQNSSNLHIEPLGKEHDRAAFSCGVAALDRYLQKQAGQDARRYAAAPFVLCEGDSPSVLGYYTLSAISVDVGELPAETVRKLPRYPEIPATLIGRLAVDRHRRGERLGEFLLMDALYRSLRQADEIAAAAVVVDAKDDRARSFYEAYDFRIFPDRQDRLFLPMTAVKKLF